VGEECGKERVMSDLNIIRLAVIRLSGIVKDLSCMIDSANVTARPQDKWLAERLSDCYRRCKQIEAELERP